MQAVEGAHAEAMTMPMREFAAALECVFRYCDFKPEVCDSISFKLACQTFGFRRLHYTTEHVLLDRMRPLGKMKRRDENLVH